MSGSSKRSIFSGATELVALDNHGINLARPELAFVPQPFVPLRSKHAEIGSSVESESTQKPLNFASLARIELGSGRPHRGVSGPGINAAT